MTPFAQLAACAGKWAGTSRLQDPCTNAPEDSASTLSIAPVLSGRFLRLDYTWGYQGKPQEGSILIGAEPESGEISACWIDSWHMGHKAMTCRVPKEAIGKIALRGSYPAPPGPDWGWGIDIVPQGDGSLQLVMVNISPENRADLAVEASYARVSAPPVGGIGQIAMAAGDVSRSLGFYRDVLGLPFLFSPSPDLAFLAAGSVRILISSRESGGPVGMAPIIYFKVDGVEALFRSMLERGAVGERPPQLVARMPDHELWIGFLRDPDGRLIGLMEEKRPQA